jgi:hypothetical protein
MPGVIDPETINVDDLPGIWSPVQWELSPDERRVELEDQASASMLWGVDIPEAILRLLLAEIDIQRAFGPPKGYDPEQQGEWDQSLVTFEFARPIRLAAVERHPALLHAEYDFGDRGRWAFDIEPEKVSLQRM